jgi:gas vesicle protein
MNTSSESNMNGSIVAFLVGTVVGAGAALLFAPCSGEETRRKIGETARRVGDNAKDAAGTIKERVSRGIHELKKDVEEAVDEGRMAAERIERPSGRATY